MEELFGLFDKNCVEASKDVKVTPFIPSHKRLLYKPGDVITYFLPPSITNSVLFVCSGDLIEVLPRLWPGINKPGGPARVVASNEEENSYDVKVPFHQL